ncbi:MAG: muconolactone Delta-isomerase family protein [Chloroflexota bacterium]
MDFLVHITFAWPAGIAPEEQQRLVAAEHDRAVELATAGTLKRLWRIPGQRANWGIWHAADATELHAALASLPMFPHLVATVHPLATHPNDPAQWAEGTDR